MPHHLPVPLPALHLVPAERGSCLDEPDRPDSAENAQPDTVEPDTVVPDTGEPGDGEPGPGLVPAPGWLARLRLDRCPKGARRWIAADRTSGEALQRVRGGARQLLTECGVPEEDAEAVILIVGELTANVARHCGAPHNEGRPWFGLLVECDPSAVWVEVFDDSPVDLPPFGVQWPDGADEAEEQGRGLMLVRTLSQSCGCVRLNGGAKAVWAQRWLDGPTTPAEGAGTGAG